MRSLPRLPYVVTDTNVLRKAEELVPLLDRVQQAGEQIMLPWTSAFELTKRTGTFWSSIRLLAERPEVVSIAKPSMTLHQRIERPFQRMVRDVTDHTSTRNFRRALVGYRDGLLDEVRANEALADTNRSARALIEGTEYGRLFRAAAATLVASLKPGERGRIGRGLEKCDRQPYRDSLIEGFTRQVLDDFLISVGVPHVTGGTLTSFPSFAALQFMALVSVAFRWLIVGGLETTKKSMDNEGVDVENVLIGLYGRGFVSLDGDAVDLYEDLRSIIPHI